MRFTKLHGHGNAYICVDCLTHSADEPGRVARLVSDPKTGIGSDGLILVGSSALADVRVEMYNADGSRMSMCGNGVRCVGKFVLDSGITAGRTMYAVQPVCDLRQQISAEAQAGPEATLTHVVNRTIGALAESGVEELGIHVLTVETDAGMKTLYCYASAGGVIMATADLGPASLRLADMDCTLPGETAIDHPVSVAGREYHLTCVSTGNLHAVLFVGALEQAEVETHGPAIECCRLFPDRANVHFVQVLSESHLRMRTWERGSGETRACGTGACAATVAALATQRSSGSCRVDQPGGSQFVDAGESVYLTGEVQAVCSGTWHRPGRSRKSDTRGISENGLADCG